jgi:CRP-like cAMP-binding protein
MLQIGDFMIERLNNEILREFSLKCCYPKNNFVCYENDLCDKIGYIVEGSLQLVHFTTNGEEKILAELKSGDIFGDFLINSEYPYFPGNLVCLEETSICFLEKEKLNKLLVSNDAFRNIYLKQLSDKALQLNQHNKILLQKSLKDKILMYINNRITIDKSFIIRINNKQTLANYLNVTRQSLSREMKLMKKDNLIDYNKKYIWLKEEN